MAWGIDKLLNLLYGIYNHSLHTGIFPYCLKIALVNHFTRKETKVV